MTTPYALGRRPRVDKPALQLGDYLRAVPEHPLTLADPDVAWGLDGNDRYGVCVVAGLDNLRRAVTAQLTGQQQSMTLEQVYADYRTQNPHFDPADPWDDNGISIQDYLAWLTRQGRILGFAAVDLGDEDEIRAAAYLFLGLMLGLNLEVAQQGQTSGGTWDYQPSSEWGGHCVAMVGYRDPGDRAVTWAQMVTMTGAFLAHQRDECWVVLLPEHLQHPGFRAGFDLAGFAAAYTQITGRPFPAVVPPDPVPTPPGDGGGWFRLAPDLAAALHRAAVRRRLTDEQELDKVLRRVLHAPKGTP